MKKNKIFTAVFLFLVAVFLLGFAVMELFGETYSMQGELFIYDEKEIVTLKKGEAIPLEDINPKFKQFKEKGKLKNMQLHYQSGYTLTGFHEFSDADLSNEQHDVFVDENGCVSGVKTGVYKLEYALVQPNVGEIRRPDTYVFKNTIAVYEAEESDYIPLTDPLRFNAAESYILTQDITLNANFLSSFHSTFSGVIINPYGYTLTVPASLTYEYRRESVFFINKGILDGLKIHIESNEQDGWYDNFYGISKYNYGLIQNCEMTGEAIVRSRTRGEVGTGAEDFFHDGAWTNLRAETWLLPQDGFTQNNKVAMTVRTDGTIAPYGEHAYDRPNYTLPVKIRREDHWIWKNNEVQLDAYYDTNVVKSTSRFVGFVEHGTPSSNTCLPLSTPAVDTSTQYTVRYKLPTYGGEYDIIERSLPKNAVLEIPSEDWHLFRRSEPVYERGYYTVHSAVEVLQWIVNGESRESLDGIIVTEDMTIEPCIKYKERKVHTGSFSLGNTSSVIYYGITKIWNTDDELVVSVAGVDSLYCRLGIDFFYELFNNPYNVTPSKIILSKEIKPCYFTDNRKIRKFMNDEADKNSQEALLAWIRAGGKLEVESGNEDLAMIGNKALCDADGSYLWYYFPDEAEKEVGLHSRIKEINGTAFFAGEAFEILDLTTVETLDYGALDSCVALKELHFGKKLSLHSLVNETEVFQFSTLLGNQKELQVITFDEDNPTYEMRDRFIVQKSSETVLVYAPPSLTGRVVLPDGISEVESYVFYGRDIEELVFGAGLTRFKETALSGMKKLKKIHFGETGLLKSAVETVTVDLSSLEEVTFDDNISQLNLDYALFKTAKLKTVVLPKYVTDVQSMFTACEAYSVDVENEFYTVQDDVLLRKRTHEIDSYNLEAYPAKRVGTTYAVPSSVRYIQSEAFYGAKLEEVTITGETESVGYSAFFGVPIQRLNFVGEGQIDINSLAFKHCNELKEVVAENGIVLCLGQEAFKNCGKLSSFPFAQTLVIGDEAFYGTGELSVVIGQGVSLGSYAFRASKVKTAVFDGYSGSVKEGTFKESLLESVDLGIVEEIQNKAFKLCANLTDIDLKNVKSLGACAFQYAGVRTVVGKNLTSFGLGAFSDTENLQSVRLPSATQITGDEAFLRSAVETVELPLISDIPIGTFHGCENLTSAKFAGRISVKYRAFYECEKLVDMDSVIVTCESNAFYRCKALESIALESDSIWLSQSEFTDCVSLKTVKMMQTNKEKSSFVSNTSFSGVTQAVEVYMDVGADFVWEGSVPSGFTVFVRKGMKEIFSNSWIVNAEQIVELSDEDWEQVCVE